MLFPMFSSPSNLLYDAITHLVPSTQFFATRGHNMMTFSKDTFLKKSLLVVQNFNIALKKAVLAISFW